MAQSNIFSASAARSLDDVRYLERCRQGDEAALSELIARHRTRLTRIAANILRDANEAEDVAQESFLKAFRELSSLRDDRAFSGFIYRICVRLCMDRLRQRRPEATEFDYVDTTSNTQVENRIVVHKLLDQLSPELRTTLVLREMEQLSYEEISESMNVPVGTVRSRLHAARDRFRTLWIHATKDVPA